MSATATPAQLSLVPDVGEAPSDARPVDDVSRPSQHDDDGPSGQEMELLPYQDEVVAHFNEGGDLVIRQKSWPEDDQAICIRSMLIHQFIDRLLDMVGVPSFGGPR